MQKTIESFEAMQFPVENLVAASKAQASKFNNITAAIRLGLGAQDMILLAVQDIQGKTNGRSTCDRTALKKRTNGNTIARDGRNIEVDLAVGNSDSASGCAKEALAEYGKLVSGDQGLSKLA